MSEIDRDLTAHHVGVVEDAKCAAMPASAIRVSNLTPDGDATLVMITNRWNDKGLYALLTPDGARHIAQHLIALADRADAMNATLAATMLGRITGSGGEA